MSSFARSFSRLTTSVLECPDVDEEEAGSTGCFEVLIKKKFCPPTRVKSSLPRCQSDSVIVPPSGSGSASVDPTAARSLRATESETVLPEGMPSVGSMLHESQQCRPCAWFWKPMGCANGSACRHCHLCPAGRRWELTRQRKVHRCMARQRTHGTRMPSRMVLQEKHVVSDYLRFAEVRCQSWGGNRADHQLLDDEEKSFHLAVKETFLEYVPDRESGNDVANKDSDTVKHIEPIEPLVKSIGFEFEVAAGMGKN
eukprot:Skav235808  [mRNA]  locus=scaffold1267:291216:302513:- [translate_table: standard]